MNFTWVGPKVNRYYDKIEPGNYDFYKSFHYREEEFNVGEFVIVAKGKLAARIGMLLCLYHSHETRHRTNPNQGIVSWYTKVKCLEPKLNPKNIKFDPYNEVIENNTETDVVISLENVVRKCTIVYGTVEDPVYLIKSKKLNKNIYFSCRYKVESGRIVPIFSSKAGNCIVGGQLKILPNFENLEVVSEPNQPQFECVFLPPVDVTPIKQLSEIQNLRTSRSTRKASATSLDFCSSDEDTEKEAVRSSRNRSKFLKLTPKGDKGKSPKILLKRNSSVRRVLNDSFESLTLSLDETPVFAYSIVNSNVETENGLKMTLKLKDNPKISDPLAIMTELDDAVVNKKSVNVSDLQTVNNRVEFSPSTKVVKAGGIRRSTRNTNRKSYAEFTSPQLETPKKRSRKTSTDASVTSKTPRLRVTRSGQVNEINEEYEIAPRRSRSVKIATEPPASKTSSINLRKTRLRSSSKQPVLDVSDEEDVARESSVSKTPKSSKTNLRKNLLKSSSKQQVFDMSDEDDIAREPPVSKPPKATSTNLRKNLLKSSSKQPAFDVSDEEDIVPKRRKSMGTLKKTPKNTPSARAKMVRDGVITPSVQNREGNVACNGTPLQRARNQLHVSHVPTALPCREKEFSDIISFLEGKLLDGCGGCMYVSGVPGTGKTATVTEVIRSLEESANDKHIPAFKYVNINGMKLSEPRQSYVEIVKQLTGKTMPWEQAQTTLENKFVKSKAISTPVILVVDELDILCTKRQDVVYNLLDWPTKGKAQLMVITIANTMDLPERLLMGRVTSRLGLTRLTFQAYTHKQLQEIVTKRLSGTNAFNDDAIQLVARKVASVSGDARRALDICRRSAEIAELEGDKTMVTMSHVNQALSAMITQPKVQAIKRCSTLEKLILQAAVAEAERTGVDETTFDCVLTMLTSLAALEGFKIVSNTILLRTVAKLGASRLLLTEQKCNDLYQRIILNVSTDDVYYAMQSVF